jgi:hypothetical protein
MAAPGICRGKASLECPIFGLWAGFIRKSRCRIEKQRHIAGGALPGGGEGASGGTILQNGSLWIRDPNPEGTQPHGLPVSFPSALIQR